MFSFNYTAKHLKFYLSTYFSKKKKINLGFNNSINFGSKISNNFFKKKLKNSKFYFEYGSGASTIYADKYCKNYYSIESDKRFFNKIKKKILNKKNLIYVNFGKVSAFSYPINIFFKKKIFDRYVTSILRIYIKKNYFFPDLILIDGRFRVSVSIFLLKFKREIIKNNTCIILDDYKKRLNYKILNEYFKINTIGRFGILKPIKKKKNYKDYKRHLTDPR